MQRTIFSKVRDIRMWLMVQLGSIAEPRSGTGLMGALYDLLFRMGFPLRPLMPSETPCPLLWASWMLNTLPSPVVTLATDHLLPERSSLPPSHRNGSASTQACSTLLLQDCQPAVASLSTPLPPGPPPKRGVLETRERQIWCLFVHTPLSH